MTSQSRAKRTEPARIRLHGARKGEIRKALDRSVEEARHAERETGSPFLVAVAERLATLADAAWRADDVATFLSATGKLTTLVAKLNLSGPTAGGGSPNDDDGTDDPMGSADPIERELASILGSGPALRDRPNAGA